MKNYANMQTLNGLWDFTFVQAELSDTEICNIAMTDIVIVPGCFDAASKFFGNGGRVFTGGKSAAPGKSSWNFKPSVSAPVFSGTGNRLPRFRGHSPRRVWSLIIRRKKPVTS